ncbi:MAG TPA: hypothetical protein VNQ48_07790 [Microbacteriaceae bacterium]|nr:hypothetical protein [Microbacteriaceae bacterium]
MAIWALRLILPSVWLGILGALAFIETPLKFLAPGVTVEIALGIGRLVLTTADLIGVGMLLVITLLSIRPRSSRSIWAVLEALWVVLIVQVAVVRPMLNARTDIVLAGGEAGESQLHTVYIVTSFLLLIGIVVHLVLVARRVPRAV